MREIPSCSSLCIYSSNMFFFFRYHPQGQLVTWKQMEPVMRARRNSKLPTIPTSLDDFEEKIGEAPEGLNMVYRGMVKDNENGSNKGVMLAHQRLLEALESKENIQQDGTFYTVPTMFYQLFTIFL